LSKNEQTGKNLLMIQEKSTSRNVANQILSEEESTARNKYKEVEEKYNKKGRMNDRAI
jgi:hypothetical protein